MGRLLDGLRMSGNHTNQWVAAGQDGVKRTKWQNKGQNNRSRRNNSRQRKLGLNHWHAVVVCLNMTGRIKERESSPKQAQSCFDLFATTNWREWRDHVFFEGATYVILCIII